ncbi:MAG: hypothetical protein V4622_08975 [Bacteroidota bacterium]
MKKIILSSLFLLGTTLISSSAFGQNVETIARKAAKDAGCIEENGAYNYQTTEIGRCGIDEVTTGTLIQVDILPKVSANIAPYVKLSPIARVTICGTTVQTVECL